MLLLLALGCSERGFGEPIPALVPVRGFGYDPDLKPYPFHPAKARDLLREAGYAEGLSITLIAPEALTVQARGQQDAGAGRCYGGPPGARPGRL
jgi:ABC-type transport system substrate-binding protein